MAVSQLIINADFFFPSLPLLSEDSSHSQHSFWIHPQMPGFDSLLLHLLQKPTPEIFSSGESNQRQVT